jgi:hypothetical protein
MGRTVWSISFLSDNHSKLSGRNPACLSSAQNPNPARPGRERYRCLRQERIIKTRDSAMLAT